MTEIESLYSEYFKDIYLYIKGLSGNVQIAEDITSETFFKAMKSLANFKGDCDIRVWLCQIAKNTYFSYLRKNKQLVELTELENQSDNSDIAQAYVDTETSERIHKILHALDEPYKEVFTLRTFGELSFKQIANLFGKTDNWACVTYHRAKSKIKERMEDYQ